MPVVQIMAVVGSAVPSVLRDQGFLVCWFLVHNGERISGPFTSRQDAQAQMQRCLV
ncbi:hypothetical protein IQ22_01864 [Pseudomonas duriflava]|uniref:Filamentous hemagglutinin n=1 Tax=Pseudomonas duriflava TaxID=459528 RepID=A0A562QDX8_9PSED|nr:hypothetical protein [Pseudomonas duriflava]TWI54957.1 hypothetical protein IQ22_01864 [Pseudomonas duriflava]